MLKTKVRSVVQHQPPSILRTTTILAAKEINCHWQKKKQSKIYPNTVKMQYVHLRSHTGYYFLPWKIPEQISRRSMLPSYLYNSNHLYTLSNFEIKCDVTHGRLRASLHVTLTVYSLLWFHTRVIHRHFMVTCLKYAMTSCLIQ